MNRSRTQGRQRRNDVHLRYSSQARSSRCGSVVKGVRSVGTTEAGQDIATVDIVGGGLAATLLSWGATLQSLKITGQDFSVILGSRDVDAYRNDLLYFGAIIGPVANRIAKARFELDGRVYELDRNEGNATTLHGGRQGLGQRNWSLREQGADFATFEIVQPAGLCGFPGPIAITATYRLLPDRVLEVEIVGTSQKPALFNPAFHGYWNLDGGPDVLAHRLTVAADRYLPVDSQSIPTGRTSEVEGTAFDYRSPKTVGPDLDHNFCVGIARGVLRPVAQLEGSRNILKVATTEPGLQVYAAGNSASGSWSGLEGRPFGRHAGLALEPQLWPDAPNHPDFPSARIAPGQTIRQVSRFKLTPKNS